MAKHRFLSDLVKEEQISFIALSETGRDDFPDHILKNLCAGRDFLWHCMAPHGRSGGILLGVDLQVFNIGVIVEGDFYVKFTLRCKDDGFQICVVYSLWPSTISKQADIFGRIGKHMLKGVSSVFNWRGFQYYEKTGR